MRLAQFLDEQNLSRAEFAEKVGVHPVTVSKWCTGAMNPRWSQIAKIEVATQGAVTPSDFGARERAA